jgi:hypothetical protein
MLTVVDTPWHVLSTLIVWLLGVVFAISQRRIFCIPVKSALLFYLWHSVLSIYYLYFSLTNPADATKYYFDSLEYTRGFDFGTAAINWLTSFFSVGLNMSYGGVFLVYNLFGYIGMIAFAGALQHIVVKKSLSIRRIALFVVLLPGLSFWSSAIGKDSISFMGAGLVCWAALNINRRYPAMFIAVLAFLLVRPHMAGILLSALSVTMIMAWRTNPIKKLALTAIAIPSTIAGVVFGLQYAGLGDASGVADVAEYFETRQGYNLGGGSSVEIAGMSVPMRLISYLFRPLFFDASGLLEVVVSFENLILLILFLVFTSRLFTKRSHLSAFSKSFFILFVIVSLFVLANTTANLGIAVRQKNMFLPMLFVLMFSYFGNRRGRPGDE